MYLRLLNLMQRNKAGAASGIVILMSLFLMAAPAGAEPVYMSDEEVDGRLNEVTQSLYSQQKNAQYWEYGWGAFDGGTMLWSAVQAAGEHDRNARGADIVQATESLVGLADVIFRPLPAFNLPPPCDISSGTNRDWEHCIAVREALMERSAERANEPYEVLPHAANAGFNLLAGLIVWRVGGRSRALATAVPGEIIGEIQLWTTPGEPLTDFGRYKVQFSPLLIETGRARSPATGVMASFRF
jgi:hypothetical protein